MWEKKALSHCFKDSYGSYGNFEEALEACKTDPNCAAIYDDFCDNQDFALCPLGYTVQEAPRSCLHMKPNGTVMVKL